VIAVEQLNVTVGNFSLQNVSFSLEVGEYGILMGRTGSGKTTLLESLCGLKPISSGRIVIDGRDVTRLKPGARGIGFVPQEGALFQSMVVRDQIGFALEIRRRPKGEVNARVEDLAGRLGITGLLDRSLDGLSGGERQRVALGRALAAQPTVLCLDEPFSALDEETRDDMYQLVRTVTREAGVTTVHITHSRSEAEQLGDRFFRLVDGRIEPWTLSARSPAAESPASSTAVVSSEIGEAKKMAPDDPATTTGDGPTPDLVVE